MRGRDGEREHSSDTIQTRLLLGSTSPPNITLLRDGELDALALRQGDPRLGALTNDENVGDPDDIINIAQTGFILPRLTALRKSCRGSP